MPVEPYEIVEFIDENDSLLGPDLDADFLNNRLQQSLADVINFANDLEANPSGMTAQQILDAIKTVDGTNSGLDADLLDGLSSGDFVRTNTLGVSVPTLVGGVIPASQLPALAINEAFTVGSQSAMLALTAQRGDIAIRTDFDPDRSYILVADDATVLANWVRVTFGDVVSVGGSNGSPQTGVVTLSATDVGAQPTSGKNQPNGYPGLAAVPGTMDSTTVLYGDGIYRTPAVGGGGSGDMLTLSQTEVSITGATTLTNTAFGKLHVLTGAANYTVGLPTAVGNAGKIIAFRVPTSVAIARSFTLDPNGTETIDGALTRVLNQGEYVELESDGTNWVRLVRKSIEIVQEEYAPVTDIANPLSVGAAWGTYFLVANRTFQVYDATSIIECIVAGTVQGQPSTTALAASRMIFNSAGTPIERRLGGAQTSGVAYFNFLNGAQPILLGPSYAASLPAGANTWRIELIANVGTSAFCRPGSQPNYEYLRVTITEKKR